MYCNLIMGPPSYMWSVIDQNVVVQCMTILFLVLDPAVLGQPCTFESMWDVFVYVAVRVASAGPTSADKHTTLISNHGLTVSLWYSEEAQNKRVQNRLPVQTVSNLLSGLQDCLCYVSNSGKGNEHCQNYWTCCTVPTCSILPLEVLGLHIISRTMAVSDCSYMK
jgi:hypothetical protein